MSGSGLCNPRISHRMHGAAALLFLLLSMPVLAQESTGESWWSDGFNFKSEADDRHFVIMSPYTVHVDDDGGHDYVWLLGCERDRANGQLTGLAYFSNSFGQPCLYYYPWGKTYNDIAGVDGLFVKWNAGIVYGYVEPYEDKLPVNFNGFTPAFFPSLGFRSKHDFQTQINLLGRVGFMLQFSVPVDGIKSR